MDSHFHLYKQVRVTCSPNMDVLDCQSVHTACYLLLSTPLSFIFKQIDLQRPSLFLFFCFFCLILLFVYKAERGQIERCSGPQKHAKTQARRAKVLSAPVAKTAVKTLIRVKTSSWRCWVEAEQSLAQSLFSQNGDKLGCRRRGVNRLGCRQGCQRCHSTCN